MGQRQITVDEVYGTIEEGTVLEIQDRDLDSDVKVLFSGDHERPFYVVVAACHPEATVVTVCTFADEAWREAGGLMRRRRK